MQSEHLRTSVKVDWVNNGPVGPSTCHTMGANNATECYEW